MACMLCCALHAQSMLMVHDELLSVFSFWLHGSWAVIGLAMKVIRLAMVRAEVRELSSEYSDRMRV
jgi:hypothetical protein